MNNQLDLNKNLVDNIGVVVRVKTGARIMATVCDKEPIQLQYCEKDRKVVVTPSDNDRFVLSVEEAAMACRSMKQLLVFNDQFEHLLSHLAQWMEDHKSKIKKAFVTVRDAGLMFLLVQNQVRFDGEFEDILSDLDIEIAQNPEYSLIHLSVLALPNCSQEGYESFLSPTYTLEYAHV